MGSRYNVRGVGLVPGAGRGLSLSPKTVTPELAALYALSACVTVSVLPAV